MTVLEKACCQIIADQMALGVAAIRTDHLFEDLGIDSLDKIEIIMAAETHFRITITDAAAEKIHTVQDLINEVDGPKS